VRPIRGLWGWQALKFFFYIFLYTKYVQQNTKQILTLNTRRRIFCQRWLCGMQGRIGFVRGVFFSNFFGQAKKFINKTKNVIGLATKVPMYNNRKNNGS